MFNVDQGHVLNTNLDETVETTHNVSCCKNILEAKESQKHNDS